jgi:hypothetical protein
MNNLEKLEIKRLLKELDFIESDYEYKNELINQLEIEFISSVNIYLDDKPELKEIFDEKINKRFQETINRKIESLNNPPPVVEKIVVEVDPKIKKIYREIAKKTHPDKVKDDELNDIYIKSTEYYESGDILSIYKICEDLNLEYEFTLDENELIKSKILSYKEKIDLLQSTFTWKWSNTDEDKKDKIIEDYIKIQLFR